MLLARPLCHISEPNVARRSQSLPTPGIDAAIESILASWDASETEGQSATEPRPLERPASSCYSDPRARMNMSAAGRWGLHLCWRSCQELSGSTGAQRSAVHWHVITATRITVDHLFSLIAWQPCDIFTSEPNKHRNLSVSWVQYKKIRNKTCQLWDWKSWELPLYSVVSLEAFWRSFVHLKGGGNAWVKFMLMRQVEGK